MASVRGLLNIQSLNGLTSSRTRTRFVRRHEQSLSGQRGQASTTRGFELEELRQDRDREREYAIAGTDQRNTTRPGTANSRSGVRVGRGFVGSPGNAV